jgi:cytoskeletal protein CcmA (bactofilin family)
MSRRLRTLGQLQQYVRVKEKRHDAENLPARGGLGQIQFNSGGDRAGIPNFTFDGTDLQITPETELRFGNNMISGSADGITLSGSKIQIDGTLEGASPLKIGGELQFVSTGDAAAFNFGPNNEAKIYYEDGGSGALIVSGSVHRGLVLSGSCVHVDKFLAIGDCSATHAITLPDTSDVSGKVKANAFVSYSSIRFKKNVQPLENSIDILKKLNGVSYDWKDTGKKDYGFIAEEVGKVLPEIVEWSANPEYANSMDYIRIISFLVEGAKEQDKKITDLENKLAIISEKLDKIKV